MDNFDNDEDIKRLLKAAYGPVAPPPEVRRGVLECLTLEAGRAALQVSRQPWERPRLVVPILIALIAGLVGYGAWLSLKLVPALLP